MSDIHAMVLLSLLDVLQVKPNSLVNKRSCHCVWNDFGVEADERQNTIT